jgi:hypothetical protein
VLRGQVFVHHAIEQQAPNKYSSMRGVDLNSLENLRGIPKELNSDLHFSKIRIEWNRFYRENPNATDEQIRQKVKEIDDKYGSQFNPPISSR